MFCPDFCCLLEDFPADDRLVGVGDDYPAIFRYHGRPPGFVVHNLSFQQDQIAGVNGIAQNRSYRSAAPAVGITFCHRSITRKTSIALPALTHRRGDKSSCVRFKFDLDMGFLFWIIL